MTLITDILDRAARQASVPAPSNWATSTEQAIAEMRDFLSETAEDILDRADLSGPHATTTTVAGTGDSTYALPATFRRLVRDMRAVIEPGQSGRPSMPLADDGEWQRLSALGGTTAARYHRLTGTPGAWSIEVLPALATGASLTLAYISTDWIVGGGSAFTATTQSTTLPRRLVECGVVWRARERKGMPFDAKLAEYEALLAASPLLSWGLAVPGGRA